MRRRLTKSERAYLEAKREKYGRMYERFAGPGGGGYTIAEGSTIVRRLVAIRETLANGWTAAEPGGRLYD